MISLKGKLTYGNKEIGVDIEIEPARVTLLTGPNLTGKSLVLRCIYKMATKQLGRFKRDQIWQGLEGVRCDVDNKIDLAIYVDAYRTSIQLYEYIRDEFAEILRLTKSLEQIIKSDEQAIVGQISGRVEDVRHILKADHDLARETRIDGNDFAIREALDVLYQLKDMYARVAAEHDLFDDFLPLLLSAEEGGFAWRDFKTGARGRGLVELSTAYAPALVAMFMIYSYGASEGREVYLLVEEPEAHAHPVMAHFLGRLAAKLAERAEEAGLGFHAVFATHSLDFLMGAHGKHSKAYILRRTAEKVYVQGVWDGRGYVPGLSDPGAYEVLTRT
ncbi:hypothetical protein [Pyrobaculum aerophilum]|uniref:ATPase AAA-type core domain-containing protein n=1 Tax=Pyrobaculum aerophilum TaxID=13773 RepID=A0A371R1I4_9CREN|nr:hypothetical protein [Pyrobaculum aerophilum]RFA95076.1 hypothetical protein CGL51_08375 [Pyrobaculum aerophilum]RFA97311.1 hypothetical protein CGL52_09585 [Pyrobaculum aerophilum]